MKFYMPLNNAKVFQKVLSLSQILDYSYTSQICMRFNSAELRYKFPIAFIIVCCNKNNFKKWLSSLMRL